MSELGSGNGSGYPGAIDTDTTIESSSTTARADVPNDLAAAIIAVQAELGTDPAGTTTDVKTFNQVEHDPDGTHQAATESFAGVVELATDAETTTGTDTGRVMPVSALPAHKGVCKAHCSADVAANTRGTAYNVSSITDNSTGNFTVNFGVTFSDANYSIVTAVDVSGAVTRIAYVVSQNTTNCLVYTAQTDSAGLTESSIDGYFLSIHGDLA